MQKKFLAIGGITALLIGAGGYLYAEPYLALNGIKSAVEAKNADALSAYIDYPALRGDLKSEVKAAMAAEAAANPGDPQAAMGAALGGAMVDQMIDGIVTPEGVKKMIDAAPAAGAAAAAGGKDPAAEMRESFKDMEIERIGLSEFKLRNPKKPDAAALHFKRDGLSWKLIGIDAPPVKAQPKPVA
jgi:Protein of unknown function (DUF2939)